MKLVIVESPAKCSKIQGFLGSDYKVIASFGHIRHLKEELSSVGIEKDFEPTFEFMREKTKAINQIKDLAKSAKVIYLAADPDREGELIAYSVCLLLKLDPLTNPRITFQEITESAIKHAVQNPKTLDMNKVNAAQARAMLDMMIGFTMSPLLWKAVGPALSAGRCQTAALRLVVEKEEEIKSFKSTSSWKINGSWKTAEGFLFPAQLSTDLDEEDDAKAFLENHSAEVNAAKLTTAQTTQWSEQPPLPLITSSLQQQANAYLRLKPKLTMQIAQRLYEAGHITYMRTDKAVLSEEAVQNIQIYVTEMYGQEYVGTATQPKPKLKKKKVKDTAVQEAPKAQEAHSSKNAGPIAQEAHEAIRPTHVETVSLPDDEDWSAQDRKLYALIWRKAVESTMAPVRGDQRSVVFTTAGSDYDPDFSWRASWRKTTFEGWRIAERNIYQPKDEDEPQQADAEEAAWEQAQKLKVNQLISWNRLTAEPHETRAPQHYSEATLIKELEQRGIGRPSTFAALVSTILDRGYAEGKSFPSRPVDVTLYHLTQSNQWPPEEEHKMKQVGGEKDRLAPTPLGQEVLTYLLEHFEDLFQYPFTASMEARLDAIAEGKEHWKQVLRDTWGTYKERYGTLKAKPPDIQQSEKQKVFSDGLKAVLSKKGPLILKESPDGDKEKTVFYGWPEGVGFQDLTEEEVLQFIQTKQDANAPLGEYNGHPIMKKSGKFGWYVNWNGKNVSCQATDTLEEIIAKLEQLEQQFRKQIGAFEIRENAKGRYMFKYALTGPSRKFVTIPATLNLDTITEKELITVYQAGLQQTTRGKQTSQWRSANPEAARGRGGNGFRSRGRGGGRGGNASSA